MNLVSVRHETQLDSWRKQVLTQKASGLTVSDWCEQQAIGKSKFYYWQAKVRQDAIISAGSGKPVAFAELRRPASQANSSICATLNGASVSLDIYNGADPATLEQILKLTGGLVSS